MGGKDKGSFLGGKGLLEELDDFGSTRG